MHFRVAYVDITFDNYGVFIITDEPILYVLEINNPSNDYLKGILLLMISEYCIALPRKWETTG